MAQRTPTIFNPPTPQLNGLTALGASDSILVPYGSLNHIIETWFDSRAVEASKISAIVIKLQGSMSDDGKKGVINSTGPVLAIGSIPERVANSEFDFRIDNTNYNKSAVAAGSVFSSNHTITASKFGAINIYIDSSGSILTLSDKLGNDQTAALESASHEAAIAISETIPTPHSHCFLGRVIIENDGSLWTANSDDLNDAGDVTKATFQSVISPYIDIVTHTFSSEELTAQRAIFTQSNIWMRYMRIYLSTLTGTGKVYSHHTYVASKVR